MMKHHIAMPDAAAEESNYHGGVIRVPGPFGEGGPDPTAVSRSFMESIDKGIEALNSGSSQFAPDVEPVPNAPIETFDIFDVHTGEHVMIWRVACRERSRHAN